MCIACILVSMGVCARNLSDYDLPDLLSVGLHSVR